MKRFRLKILSVLLLIFLIILSSCGKDRKISGEDTGNAGPAEESRINGEEDPGNPDDKSAGDPYENDKEWF